MVKRVYFVKIDHNFVGSPSFHIKINIWNNGYRNNTSEHETTLPVMPIKPKYDDRLFLDLHVYVFANVISRQNFTLLFNG